jgi:odorant receptor
MNESMFDVQVKCLQFVGFHRFNLIKRPKLHRFFDVVNVLFILTCIVSEIAFISTHSQDILAVAEACGPCALEIITIAKTLTILYHREKFYKLTDRVKNLSAEVSIADAFKIDRIAKVSKEFTLLYLSTALFTGVGFCSIPLINDLIDILHGQEPAFEMPMKSTFPFDNTQSPAYEFTYAIFCSATYITILTCVSFLTIQPTLYTNANIFTQVATDAAFIVSCLNICAHFEILQNSFDGDKKKFVDRHQDLLELAKEINDLYRPMIFTQFLTSSMLLCVLGFQLLMLKSFFQRLFVATFTLSIIIQLFVYALGGQLVLEKSKMVADNFYGNDKDFKIIIARAQRGVNVDAGFYQASLPELLSILSSAASLITLLQSLIE